MINEFNFSIDTNSLQYQLYIKLKNAEFSEELKDVSSGAYKKLSENIEESVCVNINCPCRRCPCPRYSSSCPCSCLTFFLTLHLNTI